MSDTLKIISPVDGSLYAERPLAGEAAVLATLERAGVAQKTWRSVPFDERIAVAGRFADVMVADRDRVAELLAWQIGRPISQGGEEMRGFAERARFMMAVAPQALADIEDADTLVALTNEDQVNLLACVMAKRLGARRTMALVNVPIFAELTDDLIQRHMAV